MKKARTVAKAQERLVAPFNAPDLVQKTGDTYTVALDGSWKRVSGSVVCASGSDAAARVTFRIVTDSGNTIFERVGQKGNDAPQIVEVNIPSDAKSISFVYTREGEVDAVGIWKKIKLVK